MRALFPLVVLLVAFRVLIWFGSIVVFLVEYIKQLQF